MFVEIQLNFPFFIHIKNLFYKATNSCKHLKLTSLSFISLSIITYRKIIFIQFSAFFILNIHNCQRVNFKFLIQKFWRNHLILAGQLSVIFSSFLLHAFIFFARLICFFQSGVGNLEYVCRILREMCLKDLWKMKGNFLFVFLF